MKALSIRQPWACYIIKGLKPVENRNWRTTYTGPLLIHAAKTFDHLGYQWIVKNRANLDLMGPLPMVEIHPYGCIIGQVQMVDCVNQHSSPWFSGPFGFVFRNPVEFSKPIPFRGMLGLFDVPDQIVRERDEKNIA